MRARREARMVPACPPCTNRRSAPTPCLFSAALLGARRTRRSTAMCQGILQQPHQTQSMRGLSSSAGSGIHIYYVHAQAQLTAFTTAVLQISMFRATRLQFQMLAVPCRAVPCRAVASGRARVSFHYVEHYCFCFMHICRTHIGALQVRGLFQQYLQIPEQPDSDRRVHG